MPTLTTITKETASTFQDFPGFFICCSSFDFTDNPHSRTVSNNLKGYYICIISVSLLLLIQAQVKNTPIKYELPLSTFDLCFCYGLRFQEGPQVWHVGENYYVAPWQWHTSPVAKTISLHLHLLLGFCPLLCISSFFQIALWPEKQLQKSCVQIKS